MIIGICGFAGSGKGTVGDYLERTYQFKQVSFAGVLKDITAIMFSWPRDMVEGATAESREWREMEDPFWSKKFGEKITPRIILQRMGTEVIRNNLHQDFWLDALERKLDPTEDYAITDVRFINEANMVKRVGGTLVRIRRGPEPEWYGDAIKQLRSIDAKTKTIDFDNMDAMDKKWPDVHPSEWQWLNSPIDCILENDGTLTDLLYKVDEMMKAIVDKR